MNEHVHNVVEVLLNEGQIIAQRMVIGVNVRLRHTGAEDHQAGVARRQIQNCINNERNAQNRGNEEQ